MKKILTDGIVIREKTVGDSDRLLTILTRDAGLLMARATKANNPKRKLASATEMLCFSRFELFERQEICFVDQAEVIESFFSLREDMTKLALANYFAQVAYYLNLSAVETEDYLRLLLNTLHYLQTGKLGETSLKALYELRGMAIAGYLPNLSACGGCQRTAAEKTEKIPLWFSVKQGEIFCPECSKRIPDCLPLSPDLLAALSHMLYAPLPSLFRFSITPEVESALGHLSEQYLIQHLERVPSTLDFYKSCALPE